MKRWAQFILIFSVCLLSLAVRLQASEQRVTSEMIKVALTRQGFEVISETRTMLGRVRFVAFNELIWREVVLDLSTGQIIRDYAVEFSPASPPDPEQDTMPRGGTVLDGDSIPNLIN